ncbi:Uncharacterised protein [Salmonella enterica subsp. enterica serovar Bovismorbificans]|uniref:Uncharacterized protein n=1 Tax=Salmonella enterica subsp. enterica serovar Bovismorbificans TaxID=58097 RepID=A0A655EA61_SALET|nr:Uncharacterised protein [Salmonella enterica subsp. enterica serovar Bovismorbificans]CPR40766.1 Uncharacterised protein [Salmonella enterica subsp. enterica serovar Bovismorbificans]
MDINGFIAVGLYGLFQAGANGVQCFLPANAFKFAFAAAANAFHGIVKAIRMVNTPTD